MANRICDKLRDELEPHYNELDGLVDEIVNSGKVAELQTKYFEACLFRVKALFHISKRIEAFDIQYREYLSICMGDGELDQMQLKKVVEDQEAVYIYFPFFEAVEFENLLSQAKSCLDCFAKAVGAIYNESPNNIDSLSKVLRENHPNETTKKMIAFIDESIRLHGVIIDPKKGGKKSIRDLIAHRERVDIFFIIQKSADGESYTLSEGALLNKRHRELELFSNYFVVDVSLKVWFLVRGILQNCFEVLVRAVDQK